MDFRQYLIDTFRYNDYANKLVLKKINQLTDKTEAIRFFSHLVNSQNEWLKRIQVYPRVAEMNWWEPIYRLEELEQKWNESLGQWVNLLETITEEELIEEKNL